MNGQAAPGAPGDPVVTTHSVSYNRSLTAFLIVSSQFSPLYPDGRRRGISVTLDAAEEEALRRVLNERADTNEACRQA